MRTDSLIVNQQAADHDLELLHAAHQGNKYALAQLVSIFENGSALGLRRRVALLTEIESQSEKYSMGFILGITGAPGTGKSTLIGKLAQQCLHQDKQLKIAVIAVDPSSTISGGSILGDRTRIALEQHHERFYFRSQSTNQELGGVTESCYSVCRLLRYFFDYIIIETVGIGQNEIDIHSLAEHVLLIVQPFSGDQIQYMKAGIMEIPDGFVINKCDETTLAAQSYHALKHSLLIGEVKPIFKTSAIENDGVEELANYLLMLPTQSKRKVAVDLNKLFIRRWIKHQFGLKGLFDFDNNKGLFEKIDRHSDISLESYKLNF